MKIYPTDRIAIFIDGPNLWGALKALQFDMDYMKLAAHFAAQGVLVRCAYFTRMVDIEEFTPIRPLVDWLDYHSWHVVTRDKDTDVDLAVAMVEAAPGVDHFILVSGDGDLCPAVEAVQRQMRRVSILSTIKAHNAGFSCSDALRRQADGFLELEDLKGAVSRSNPRFIPVIKEGALG